MLQARDFFAEAIDSQGGSESSALPLRWCCIAGIDIHPSADSREECHRNAHVVRDLVAVRALKFLRGDLEGCSLDNVGFAAREPDYRMMGLAARCDHRGVFTFHQRLFKARQTIRRAGKPSTECSEVHGLKDPNSAQAVNPVSTLCSGGP